MHICLLGYISEEHSLFSLALVLLRREPGWKSREKRGYPRSPGSMWAPIISVTGTLERPSWCWVSFCAAVGVINPNYFGCTLLMPFPSQLLEWLNCHNPLTSLVSQGHQPSWVMVWGIGSCCASFCVITALDFPQAPLLYPVQTKLIIFLQKTPSCLLYSPSQ